MVKNILLTSVLLLSFILPQKSGYAQNRQSEISFSVMVWNIWHGGKSDTIERDGVDDVVGIIKASEADIVLMIETYGSGKRIADSLGYYFHLIDEPGTKADHAATNLSILSRFPFGERVDFYRYFNVGGIEIMLGDDEKILVFNTWLNYQPWKNQPQLLDKTPRELVEWERSGSRENEVNTILNHLIPYLNNTENLPVILGGDFNVWSHLDWTEATKDQHSGKIVPWWTTSRFEEEGLQDSYRIIKPDPAQYPGISWGLPGEQDDHRIDYLLFKSSRLMPVVSEIHKVDYNDSINYRGKSFSFPSDHGFVWTEFVLEEN